MNVKHPLHKSFSRKRKSRKQHWCLTCRTCSEGKSKRGVFTLYATRIECVRRVLMPICVPSPGYWWDGGADPKPKHILPFCKWYWWSQVHARTVVGTFDPDSGGSPGEPQWSQPSDGPGSLWGRHAPRVSVLPFWPFLSCLLYPSVRGLMWAFEDTLLKPGKSGCAADRKVKMAASRAAPQCLPRALGGGRMLNSGSTGLISLCVIYYPWAWPQWHQGHQNISGRISPPHTGWRASFKIMRLKILKCSPISKIKYPS